MNNKNNQRMTTPIDSLKTKTSSKSGHKNPQLYDAVLYILGQIPKGKVTSYGKVATLAGYSNQARQVGKILASLPKDSCLPWHRIINSQGNISFAENSSKYQQQKERLETEGITVRIGKINLKEYAWLPDQ